MTTVTGATSHLTAQTAAVSLSALEIVSLALYEDTAVALPGEQTFMALRDVTGWRLAYDGCPG